MAAVRLPIVAGVSAVAAAARPHVGAALTKIEVSKATIAHMAAGGHLDGVDAVMRCASARMVLAVDEAHEHPYSLPRHEVYVRAVTLAFGHLRHELRAVSDMRQRERVFEAMVYGLDRLEVERRERGAFDLA